MSPTKMNWIKIIIKNPLTICSERLMLRISKFSSMEKMRDCLGFSLLRSSNSKPNFSIIGSHLDGSGLKNEQFKKLFVLNLIFFPDSNIVPKTCCNVSSITGTNDPSASLINTYF